jgi:hypothetical protein
VPKVQVDTNWSIHGLRAIILENSLLRAVILPEVGARIYQIIYKPHDSNLLWTNPRIAPAKVPYGSHYDDVWCGGWDESFPNNEPGVINGELFPDHGEIWGLEWDWETTQATEEVSARFLCQTRISDVQIEKTITLRSAESNLQVRYSITNRSAADLPMLWNLHAAMAVSEHSRLQFPPMKVRLEPSYLGTLQEPRHESSWPFLRTSDGSFDLSRVPPISERRLHFFYGLEMEEGWFGVAHAHANFACGLCFEPSVFRSCWLFASFGAWRNLNVAVLEPSTGYPFKIEEAVNAGTCAWLRAGLKLETSVMFSVAEGISCVKRITPKGEIYGDRGKADGDVS